MHETLTAIYAALLRQFGADNAYTIQFIPSDGRGFDWIRITYADGRPIVEGIPSRVLAQAKQW